MSSHDLARYQERKERREEKEELTGRQSKAEPLPTHMADMEPWESVRHEAIGDEEFAKDRRQIRKFDQQQKRGPTLAEIAPGVTSYDGRLLVVEADERDDPRWVVIRPLAHGRWLVEETRA